MTHPAHTPTTSQTQQAEPRRIYGLYTLHGDSRLVLARIDEPDRVATRGVRLWRVWAAALVALLWGLAALLYHLAI